MWRTQGAQNIIFNKKKIYIYKEVKEVAKHSWSLKILMLTVLVAT